MITHRGVEIPQSLAEVCRPDRMALVVYDMQVGILRQLGETAALLAAVGRAIAAARGAGMRIVFLRHTSPPLAWTGGFQMRMAMAWQRTSDPAAVQPWFLKDAPGTAITPELAPGPDDLVLDKTTMSAFEGTPLAMLMRDCGLIAFAVVGVATEIGIEPTVRHAADLGLLPVVLEDACAGGHAEAAERALASMRFIGDALFATTAAFEAALAAPA